MATLTDRQRTFIVQELACFSTPSEVVEAVNERFGVEVSRQQVQHYDPTVGRDPADKWVEIFHASRETFVRDTARHGIAHRSFRLRELQDLYRQAKERGALGLTAEILEQAAKEVGEKYTNLQQLEHSGEIKGGEVKVYLPGNGREDLPAAVRERMSDTSGNGASP